MLIRRPPPNRKPLTGLDMAPYNALWNRDDGFMITLDNL